MSTSKSPPNNLHNQESVSDEAILKIAKEITVKFIEVGRISPATFDEAFRTIYQSIKATVRSEN